MLKNYRFLHVSNVLVVAGIVGHALFCVGIGASAAAPLGTIAALKWGMSNDPISKSFKTDVERILEPSKEQIERVGVPLVYLGLAVASAAGFLMAAALAAPLGVFAIMLLVYWHFRD